MLRLVNSLNRGMNALGESLDRHGFMYVVLLSLIVLFASAAGIDDIRGMRPANAYDLSAGDRG